MDEIKTISSEFPPNTNFGFLSFAFSFSGLVIYIANFVRFAMYWDGGAPHWLIFSMVYISPIILVLFALLAFVFGRKSLKTEVGWAKRFGIGGICFAIIAILVSIFPIYKSIMFIASNQKL